MDAVTPRKEGIPDVIIVGRRDAAHLVRDPDVASWLRHAISITDADVPSVSALRRLPSRLHLQFGDVSSGSQAVTRDDVSRLVRFCQKVSDEPGPTLVHCEHGLSRSAAAAYVLFAMLLGPGNEAAAMAEVVASAAWASRNGWRTSGIGVFPNRRMVEFADVELDRGGQLMLACRSWGSV